MSGTAAWWTDPHFELLSVVQRKQVLNAWSESLADCAIVTGDISHGSTTLDWLRQLAEVFDRPVYFVLGNHDYYGTSIARQREAVGRLCGEVKNLYYLTSGGVVALSTETALVGHDGWGDMREGDWEGTGVRPPDFDEIEDLKRQAGDRNTICKRLRELGSEAAGHLDQVLPEALEEHERVIVATHVPPFREASWYDGENSTEPWLAVFLLPRRGRSAVENGRAISGSGSVRSLRSLSWGRGGADSREPPGAHRRWGSPARRKCRASWSLGNHGEGWRA